MGILIAGYLGAMYNKLGNAVGSNWKGINTVRTYAIPANPNTVAQQAQRTKFKAVSLFAKSLIATLVTTFWNPFAVKMSGYNALVKSVFPDASSTGLLTTACNIAKGSLETISGLVAEYSAGTLGLTWSGSITGNGLITDSLNVLIVNKTNNSIVHYESGFSTRGDESQNLNIAIGLTATNLLVFVFASRGTGSDFIVSNSLGVQAVSA